MSAIPRPSARRYLFAVVVLTCYIGAPWYAAEEPNAAPDPRVLRGQLLGDDGRPLAGAVVRFKPVIADEDRATKEAEVQVAHSGEDGRFSTEETAEHRYDVRVHVEGYAFWTERNVDPSRPLSVQLVRGLPLTGRVLAETTGHGIAGATVRIDDDETFALGGVELETSTDKDGRYAFSNAPQGTVWIRASAPFRATRSISGHVYSTGDDAAPAMLDDVWLPEGGRVSGRVVDSDDDPIPGAKILLDAVDRFLGDHRDRFGMMTTRSDDDGRFSFDGVTAGTRYKVFVKSDRHAWATAGPLTLDAGDELDDVTMTLQAGAALRLRLVDPEQNPVTDLTVRLYSEKDVPAERAGQRQVVRTDRGEIELDEKGFLTARRLQPGTFTANLEPRNWMNLTRKGVTLGEGETTDLGTMTVSRGAMVTGRVVDADDDPIGDAEIVVRWRDFSGEDSRGTESREDGTFSVAGLPEYTVELTASADGFAERSLEGIKVDGEPIVIELSRPGSITGRVKLPDGGIPPVFSVKAAQDRSAKKPSSRRDGSNGSFEIDGLDPGTYGVLIRAPGNAMARLEKIRVRGGATTDAGEILLACGLRLEGRVVRDDSGAGCAGAAIRLDRGAGPASWSDETGDAVTVSDVRGRFSLDGLEAGRYTLTVDHPEFAPLLRSVDLDAEVETADVELRLGMGGEIRGTVVDAEGLPLQGVNVYMFRGFGGFDRRMVATRDDGSFHFPRLAPGSYIVMRSRPPGQTGFNSQIRTIEVRAAKTTEVNF